MQMKIKRKLEYQHLYQIFKIKTVTRDKEGHDIMIKGSTQEEDITIINVYAPNIGTSIHKENTNSYKRGNQQ